MPNPFDQFDEPKRNPFDQFDEGGPQSNDLNKNKEKMTRAQRYIAGIGKATPEEIAAQNNKKTGKLVSAGIGFAEAMSGGNFAEIEGTKAAYPGYAGGPLGTTLVAEQLDRWGLLPKKSGGGSTDFADTFEAGFEGKQAKAMTDNPFSYGGGQLAGYFVPGTATWNAGKSAVMSAPGAQTLATQVGRMGRIPSWLGRIAGSVGALSADAAVFGATVGASDQQALTGEKATASSRLGQAKDMAFANIGDAGDAMGVDVPDWARKVPINAVAPFVGSFVERGVKGAVSGGKTITPDRVQAPVLQNTGRAPSPNSTAAIMADVLPAERITGGTIKTFRFIENALRNGLKDSGLAPAEITSRVTRGFNRIHEALPALADGRTTLAQIVEREFADAGPQVSENLRLFLLRVGLDDPAVTRGVIDEMRTGQVEDFRQAVDENFGAQDTYQAETQINAGLDKLGEGFEQILGRAKEQGSNSPLSHSLREELIDSSMKFELTDEASKRGWKDVDTYINQDPWGAAHRLKSKLLTLGRKNEGSGSYEKYMEPAIRLREMLNELPGYQRLAETYAKEAQVLDTLGHTKTVGNTEVKVEGFGPQLRKDSRRARDVARRADKYAGMPERQQGAARLSTGEVLKDQLRTARPGGTNLEGQDLMGLRLTDLQNEGMMSTNADMPGALPRVFGEAGENVSQRVDGIVDARRFLADIDPKTGSNTVNKANAQMSGDSVVTSGLPRTVTSGYTQSGLIDATMFASGLPPVATMLTKGLPMIGKLLGPGRNTRAEIAQTLMQRPARRGPPPTSPEPIKPMSGRNRPTKWRKDPKWGHPVLSNPQIDPPKKGILGNENGSISIDGIPRRRKDVMKDVRSGSFPATQVGQTPPAPTPPPPPGGPMSGPLPWLAGLGAAGTGVGIAADEYMSRPEAAVDAPQAPPGAAVAPFGPSAKPNLEPVQAQVVERANLNARDEDQAQRQQYWEHLKSKGDGSSVEWNRIHQERASDLELSPADAARGVIRKRLPYVYDAPVGVLRNAPVEELINGQWVPAQEGATSRP